jgi:hypothetical protein
MLFFEALMVVVFQKFGIRQKFPWQADGFEGLNTEQVCIFKQ